VKRRTLLAGIGLLAAGGAAGTAAGMTAEPADAAGSPTARNASPTGAAACRATVTFRTAPSARLVALTIDDGPTDQWTPQVLQILRRRAAKATFFEVGMRAQANPGMVSRVTDAGHEVANHTWAHSDLTRHDEAFGRASLERTHDLLAKLTGRPPALCRPPYGRIDSVGLVVCASLDYEVMLWSNWVNGGSARADVDETLQRASPGSIVLAHDGGPQPNATLMRELDRLVGSMTDKGYTLVTVSELLAASR
jgi:peptidoglycan/xylan/chitin deacetylase (PgdA/CDA1 family)